MSHPCVDHLASCDHCYLCDVVGVCCATISPAQRAQLEAGDSAQRERLYAAITQDAGTVPSLPELMRRDARHSRALSAAARLGLDPAPTADPLSHDSRKEALHVIPARSQ
jgi:hypothetical protein